VSSSCSDSDNLRIIKVTNQVISHEWGKDWGLIMTYGSYQW
jgi:hypothetical protein